jgi:hypothetical protein
VLRLSSVELFLHHSLAAAQKAFRRLPPLAPAGRGSVTAHRTSPTTEVIPVDSCSWATQPCSGLKEIHLGTVPSNLLNVPADSFSSHPVLPAAGGAVERSD